MPEAFAIYQSIWAMENLPWREPRKWSVEEQIERIAAAGFEGIALDDDHPQLAHAVRLARELGLGWCASVFPGTADELARSLDTVLPLAPAYVNLQPDFRPATVAQAIPTFLEWQRLAAGCGCPVRVETHRDRATTDLMFTLELLDALPQMELTADLSHFLVGREFPWPVRDEDHRLIKRILDHSSAFHGRVASREQVQISIAFPQNVQWVELFLGWWDEGFRRWRRRAQPSETLIFTVELGPPWYAITGADGEELCDRWEEAVALKDIVSERWSAIEQAAV
jgi:sugar phosphate isomerase/epimerase